MGGSGIEKLKSIVEHFENNLAQIKSQQYNETQARREFIDPFFSLLGWDIDNRQGYAEAYKDVIHEDAIKVGGFTKAPDYCFRIGGTRKFFVEAKKPFVNIKEGIDPAYQLRRYAWSAKLPLSILTDFEEFAVYDCRTKPSPGDKSAVGRVKYLNYTDYIKEWDYLYSTFSREAILKGSFDKYIEDNKAKKGTGEVDKAFLLEIEAWRDSLARNIAVRNPQLSTRELNFAVQSTIDRIIFLRICEDRGVEDYARLMGLLNGEGVYPRLMQNFREADERYNSGLFHFEPEKGRETHDTLTPGLTIDDKPLKEMIKRLYYPESPYEFSVIPADILGQVYEQFLGKVIRLTAGHQAKVEDKPEVKKAGGVYYTPTYIVDYIVKNTVGKILEGKTPAEVSKVDHPIRILDPACGSGSFLLGAYEYLLTWYRDEYIKANPEKYSKGKEPKLYQAQGGQWKLTTSERKRILLSHIYGVDIDSQAVEVTKLSLLLKVLEGETKDSVSIQRKLFNERALPDLSKNIKCGNSLIGSDFYKDKQRDLFGEEEMMRINAFDWEEEFKEVFKDGGFDAVIGNPPYGINISTDIEKDFVGKHPIVRKVPDSYCCFMLKGLALAKKQGLVSLIVPNTFCDLENGDEFRKFLLNEASIISLWQSGWAFKTAVVDTVVFVIENSKPAANQSIRVEVSDNTYNRTIKEFLSNKLSKIDYRNHPDTLNILKKIYTNSIALGEISEIRAGVKMYEKGKGQPQQTETIVSDRPYSTIGQCPKGWRPLIRGTDISRYSIEPYKEFVNYGPWLAAPRTPELFSSPKILMRRTDDRLRSCIESDSAICVNSCHVIKIKKEFSSDYSYSAILGILNSRLIQYYFAKENPQMIGKVFAEIKVIYVERLPISKLHHSDHNQESLHSQMVSLVDSMLSLHKKLQSAKTEQDRTFIQRQIASTDREIDRLVYELYGLTEEEIKIVEGEK